MNDTTRNDDFLAAATAGLKADPELQLDVQAELRSHLEARRREAEAAGLAPGAAADEAVRAMGPAAKLAADLEAANLRRMRLRGLVRLAVQWLLAPLAVAIALLTFDWPSFRVMRMVRSLSNESLTNDVAFVVNGKLTPDQWMVLRGDPSRPTRVEQEKAIWERWPTNRVYLHNYVTHWLSAWSASPHPSREKVDATASEIAALQPLDPDNARFDFILASLLLDQSIATSQRNATGPDGTQRVEYTYTIKDRARLDDAMAHFKAGLGKPEYRRYSREMSLERLAIMGEPTSLMQQISQISLQAGMLLPDLAYMRNLNRVSLFYGERLADEGKREEADVFLNAYKRLVPLLNDDGFTLIDALVVGAIAAYAEERVPAVYEKLGDAVAAERAKAEGAALAAPIREWRARRAIGEKSAVGRKWEQELKRHGGILAGTLLPAIGEYPTMEELAPSRSLEYVVAEGLALALLSVILFAVMLSAALAAAYFRRVRGGGNYTLLLLPQPGEVARLMALGVLLPLLLYYLFTRWLPGNGRDLGFAFGGPAFAAQLLLLLLGIVGTLAALADRLVRRRCRELLLPVPPPVHGAWRIVRGIVLAILAFMAVTADLLSWDFELSLIGLMILLAAVALVELGRGIVRDVRFGRNCAAYYGSLARLLVPLAALALILVNVSSRPYLRVSERRLMQSDTLMRPDPDGGFTTVESRLTRRLKAEIQKATGGKPDIPNHR